MSGEARRVAVALVIATLGLAALAAVGLPAFYELHVWAWKDNPTGTFADMNPTVSCDAAKS